MDAHKATQAWWSSAAITGSVFCHLLCPSALWQLTKFQQTANNRPSQHKAKVPDPLLTHTLDLPLPSGSPQALLSKNRLIFLSCPSSADNQMRRAVYRLAFLSYILTHQESVNRRGPCLTDEAYLSMALRAWADPMCRSFCRFHRFFSLSRGERREDVVRLTTKHNWTLKKQGLDWNGPSRLPWAYTWCL